MLEFAWVTPPALLLLIWASHFINRSYNERKRLPPAQQLKPEPVSV